MSKNTKPCPFCGSDKIRLHSGPCANYVYCENCLADGPFTEKSEEAWEKWNTRYSVDGADSIAERN